MALTILSLGAGVQSSTLALMVAYGELGPIDAAIFADTGHEPRNSSVDHPDGSTIDGGVYGWLDWLADRLPYPVHRVAAGDLALDSLRLKTSGKSGRIYSRNLIPAYVLKHDGKKGILGRKCTHDYKIAPIRRLMRTMAKSELSDWRKRHKSDLKVWNAWEHAAKVAKAAKTDIPSMPFDAWHAMQADAVVEQWIGISTDEAGRMKESRVPWIRTVWPLIDRGMSRADCLAWLRDSGYPVAPRSACTFCPFHGDEEWQRLKSDAPADFEAAVRFERDLQEACTKQEVLRGVPFLHASLVPLDEVVFRDTPARSQLALFAEECEGMCGV